MTDLETTQHVTAAPRPMFAAGAIAAGVLLDQGTKHWAEAILPTRGVVQLIDGFLDLRLAHNRGAFFSLGASLPQLMRVAFFVAASLIAIVAMLRLFLRTPPDQRGLRCALTLLCCGALGNMIDRIRNGEVTDFMHLHAKEWFHWATFNFADVFIAVGLTLLALDLAASRRPNQHS